MMKITRYLLGCAFLSLLPCAPFHASAGIASEERDYLLGQMSALSEEYHLPSFSIAMVLDGELAFADAIGTADIDNNIPATPNTQYAVGSVVKPMTGLALLKLSHDEKLSLNDFVSKYISLPAYSNRVTLRQLASHTAGVPHKTRERVKAEFKEPSDYFDPLDAFWVFDQHDLLFEPGTNFEYSSHGYILLSAVIQKAANTPFLEYLDSNFFKPYKMSMTEIDTSFAGVAHEAAYYKYEGDYKLVNQKRDRSFLSGAGGFISTPSDQVRLSKATFDGRFITQEENHELRKPVNFVNGEENPQKYSIGFRVGSLEVDGKSYLSLHHGGTTSGAAISYLYIVPDCKASVAFATNLHSKEYRKIRSKVVSLLANLISSESCAP
jgi:serine beta-lactamase-like protein LACTB